MGHYTGRMADLVRIGSGAGFSGDRIDPAVELAEQGEIDYLVFECLAERTIALGQLARLRDPRLGYDPLLEARWRAVLPACRRRGIPVITDMGAANPTAAATRTLELAAELGLAGLRVGLVSGDDVLDRVRDLDLPLLDGGRLPDIRDRLVSANAYLGAEPVAEALRQGAEVVVTGRVADPSLFVAPILHAFGWTADDWPRLGMATAVAHLLECAGQVTGGYFADPGLPGGLKDVPGLARLGFPIGEVRLDGGAVITKVKGSGGMVSVRTCAEQLLYEVHDPSAYVTPDVVADFSQVTLRETGPDRVALAGATGRPRTPTLKVSLGYRDGFLGEASIAYGGPGCQGRARLALEVLEERFRMLDLRADDLRLDLVGVSALYPGAAAQRNDEPNEVLVRAAARCSSAQQAEKAGLEVEALLTCGPAGGAGARKSVREIIAVASVLLERDSVPWTVALLESPR